MADYSNIQEGAGKEAVIKGLKQGTNIQANPDKVYNKTSDNLAKNQNVVGELSKEKVTLQNMLNSGTNKDGTPLTPEQRAGLDANIKDIQERLDFRNNKIQGLTSKNAMAKQALQEKTKSSERALLNNTLNDPSKVINKASVPSIDGKAGMVGNVKDAGGISGISAASGQAGQAGNNFSFDPSTMTADMVSKDVRELVAKMDPAQGDLSKRIKAAQGDPKKMAQLKLDVEKAQATVAKSATMNPGDAAALKLEAAQTTAGRVEDFGERTLQQGELIDGSTVDQSRVDQVSDIKAEQGMASEDATVRGQMSKYMQDFEGGKTPPWAAGAMRQANEMLAARGLGASSVAGQAVVQAAMEAATPLAQADAATIAAFERDNLSNRQQAAMASAKLRADFLGKEFDQEFETKVKNAAAIADVANINFTAKQQVALENARIANTVNIANLNAKNAKVLSDAATLSQIDVQNLQNEQQTNVTNATLENNVNIANLDAETKKLLSDSAAMTGMEMGNLSNVMVAKVNNAKNFLDMDLANLSNEQQTNLFKFQARVDSLLSDQSATNVAAQFNAASENTAKGIMADIAASIEKVNAQLRTDMSITNITEANKLANTKAVLQAGREEFNVNHNRELALANAKWKQDMGLAKFDAEVKSNSDYARDLNSLTGAKLDQLWMKERDIMSYAFQAAENQEERNLSLLLGNQQRQDAEKEGWGRLAAIAVDKIFDWL